MNKICFCGGGKGGEGRHVREYMMYKDAWGNRQKKFPSREFYITLNVFLFLGVGAKFLVLPW